MEFEKRKTVEKEKRRNKVKAHQLVVSRAIAKRYTKGMGENVKQYLCDVGYFTNRFKTEVLEQDVLPWLEGKVLSYVEELEKLYDFPNDIVDDFI